MNVLADFKNFINREQVYIWLVSAVLISLPLKHSLNSITIVIFLLYAVFYSIINREAIKFETKSISIPLLSIYMLGLLSLIWTINTQKSLEGLTQKLSYLLIPLIFFLISKRPINASIRIFQNFSIAMVLYGIYAMGLGLFIYLKRGDPAALYYHKLSMSISNMNAIYMSVFTASALLFFLIKKEKRIIEFMYLLILSVFLILLSSKLIISVVLILVVLSIFLMQRESKKKRVIPLILVGILVFSIILSQNIIDRFNTEISKTHFTEALTKKEFGQVYYWTGTSLRLFQFRTFMELMMEDKVFLKGYGLDASQSMLKKKYREYDLYQGYYHYDFHNQYLQIFAELGVFGFLFLLALFYLCLKKAIGNNDFFFFSFIILILILCTTESYLWRQRGMVFFITVVYMFYTEPIKKRKLGKKVF